MRVMSSMQGSWVRMRVVVRVVVSGDGGGVSGDGGGVSGDGGGVSGGGERGKDDGETVRGDGGGGRVNEDDTEERTQPSPFFITTHHV